jgi:WD40 repeat protein
VSKVKAHNEILHMILISPDDNYFMTGATDGSVNIWRPPETSNEINELIDELETGRKDGSTRKEHPFKKNLVQHLSPASEMQVCQCDSLQWSCRGRYAIASFGGKEEEESILDKSIIYVWDNHKNKILHKFGSKGSNIVLENFTFVIECHPKNENFFMTGGGAGKVILWDIGVGESVKTFIETGVYHRDANILNEVFDGKFSYCGKYFVVTTVWGTITIFSIYDKEPYLATPVEQFFQYDKLPEATSNIYNEKDAVLCNYDRMKYPDQPPLPILGERYIGRTMDPFDYNFGLHNRYDTFSKDQKYFENYVDQYGAYAFLSK